MASDWPKMKRWETNRFEATAGISVRLDVCRHPAGGERRPGADRQRNAGGGSRGVHAESRAGGAGAAEPPESERSRGLAGAILVNAGNANCATRTGEAVALATTKAAAKLLKLPPAEVLVASTGVIGVELEAGKITGALGRGSGSLKAPDSGSNPGIPQGSPPTQQQTNQQWKWWKCPGAHSTGRLPCPSTDPLPWKTRLNWTTKKQLTDRPRGLGGRAEPAGTRRGYLETSRLPRELPGPTTLRVPGPNPTQT